MDTEPAKSREEEEDDELYNSLSIPFKIVITFGILLANLFYVFHVFKDQGFNWPACLEVIVMTCILWFIHGVLVFASGLLMFVFYFSKAVVMLIWGIIRYRRIIWERIKK